MAIPKAFAPVAPIALYEQLQAVGMLGSYHLLLAHEVLKEPTRHRNFYGAHKNSFVIMDNSLIELGESLPAQDLIRAATIVNANTLVLPDKLLDKEATIRMSLEAAEELMPIRGTLGFLVMAQGRNEREALECATYLAKEIPGVNMIGIPRALTAATGSRIAITQQIFGSLGLPIHQLGFSDNMQDDILSARLPGVMGIDSAVPIRLGIKGWRLKVDAQDNNDLPPREENYWLATDITPEVITNLDRVRGWLNTKG